MWGACVRLQASDIPPPTPGALSPLRSREIADSTSERVSGLGRGSTARVTFSGAWVPQKGLEPLTSPVTLSHRQKEEDVA